ncbi:DNA recombination protein RmuC [Sneathiella sp. CAU 1612]|uniref:DNA recombination protein RmuC homolog n=1 Tax=Sneathiella sedimenti TaxID=2816034 RepID=A0ABS3F2M0_9PROT|nr:DNA recombination protein RmuC [Sneathiella sedimenti]MBO0332351.1 DNA recombination protein RmuC [Sneathiella sedimenti]
MEIALIAVIAFLVVVTLVLFFKMSKAEKLAETASTNSENLTRLTESLINQQAQLEGQLKQISTDSAQSRQEINQTLSERLDTVSKRLGDSLSQSAEKTGQSLTELQARLAVIDKAQTNLTELSNQVVGLQDILANKQARGAFGEIQLNDLVKSALPPSAYDFQVTLSNGRRADCLIKLPNPPGSIVVDAKFPLESYHMLRQAETDSDKLQANRAFTGAMQKHIADISEKYILDGETAESALLFLPSEAVYAELHANFPAILERSYKARVWIVSPTTLMATLNTVRAVLKDSQMRAQAGVIQKEVGVLLKDVERLDARVDNLGKHFLQASKDIELIETSSRKISSRAEKIEELQLGEEDNDLLAAPPEQPHQIEEQD